MIYPIFLRRDFSDSLVSPNIELRVDRLSHHVIGGPEKAQIIARGYRNDLAKTFNYLRAPVQITNRRGTMMWTGFVSGIQFRYRALTFGVSLDSMANAVSIMYTKDNPDGSSGTDKEITPIALDERSAGLFGIKEFRETLSQGSEEQAEIRRDFVLETRRRPIAKMEIGESSDEASVTFECMGWWRTLYWRYYQDLREENSETSQQIRDIVSAAGQFITGVRIYQESGITSSTYREGDNLAGEELEGLLKCGSTGATRYLARIDEQRMLHIYNEPLPPDIDRYLMVRDDGTIRGFLDQPLPPDKPPIGMWAKVVDLPPAMAFTDITDPTTFFLESAEYTAATDSWSVLTRTETDARDMSSFS
jgi:hypothetical protein